MKLPGVVLALFLLALRPALADADMLFQRGQFAAAADAARAEGSAASLALAARATLVVAAYEVADKAKALRLIDEAEADADRALVNTPGSIDAALQKAVAIGYRAKLKRSPGMARTARAMMEAAAKREPRRALAWASLGGWHGEAVTDLGRLVAGTLVGAKTSTSIDCFERAVALDPASPVYRTFYAITLVGIGRDDPAKLRALLAPAANGRGGDGFDQLMRARARALLAALDGGGKDALRTAAKKAAAFAMLD